MRFHLHAVALVGAAFSTVAAASTLPDEAPDGKRWMSCTVKLQADGKWFDMPTAIAGYWLVDVPDDARKETEDRLKAQWLDEYVGRVPSEFPGFTVLRTNGSISDARCTSYSSRSEWAAFAAHVKEPVTSKTMLRSDFVPSFAQAWVSTREHARDYTGEVAFSGNIKPGKSATTKPTTSPSEVSIAAPDSASSAKTDAETRRQHAQEAEAARKAAREQREAEFQAKMAEHEAGVAEYNRKLAEREAEIERQNAQQSAAKEAAARELEAYRIKAAAAERLQKEYDAAQKRHSLCLAGNDQACADIAAGKSVAVEVADAGKASTDSDATRCVSSPVVGQSSTWKDAIAATVVNGCPTAVDIRICLLRDGGWNCGVNWGLKPQESWSWSSFKSNGELFWDARVSGSNRPLGSPAGM